MLRHPGDEAERVGSNLLLYFQEKENVKFVSKTGPKFDAKLVETVDSENLGSKILSITTRYKCWSVTGFKNAIIRRSSQERGVLRILTIQNVYNGIDVQMLESTSCI